MKSKEKIQKLHGDLQAPLALAQEILKDLEKEEKGSLLYNTIGLTVYFISGAIIELSRQVKRDE